MKPRRLPRFARAALVAVVGAAAAIMAPVRAASLQISPVSIRFADTQQAAAISLQNMGDEPIYGQVRLYRWEQKDGEDVLTPTRDLIASPPIVQIGAHATQVIRLVMASSVKRVGEGSYRILIDELGREAGGEAGGAAQGVDIRLRYSVPVFVAAAAGGAVDARDDALVWQVFQREGSWMLRVRNQGGLHAQIGALDISNSAGERFDISKGLFGYVLAGRERLWKLPLDAKARLGGVLTVRAVINARAPAQFLSAAP